MAVGHRVRIEGAAASIRLGYLRAATLGAWSVEGDRFAAAVLDVDAYRVTQSPLVLEIPNRDGIPTRRELADVVVVGGHLTARLVRQPRA